MLIKKGLEIAGSQLVAIKKKKSKTRPKNEVSFCMQNSRKYMSLIY